MKNFPIVKAKFEIWIEDNNSDKIIQKLEKIYPGNLEVCNGKKKNTIIFWRWTKHVTDIIQKIKNIEGVNEVLYLIESQNPS